MMRGRAKRWSVISAMAVVAVLAIVSGCSNELMDVEVEESEPETQEEPETYTVSFNRQGGIGGSTSVVATLEQPMPPATAPTKEDAGFYGYYTGPNGTGTQYYTAAMESARDWDLPADTELIAYWIEVGGVGPAGGIVFYDKGEYTDGWRYLEAWTADEEGTYQWKTENTGTPGTSTDVGSGYENTYSAMTGAEHPAAQVVRSATHGGYDDWFLPSRDELDLMYDNLYVEGLGGFPLTGYWSSSQGSAQGAWYRNFVNGNQGNIFKDIEANVRAVRAF